MKTFLPWLLAVLAVLGAGFFYKASQAKTTELAELQPRLLELETLRTENEELKQNQVAPEELARLKASQEELLRLRNEVRQLRVDKTQLNQQAQAAQTAAAQAREQAQVAQAQVQEAASKAASERQAAILAAQQAANPGAANACINNLRQLDAIKQQWGLDHQKTAAATPTHQDLTAYFAGQPMPPCPGGGKYSFGNLSVHTTCSIAGHAIPQ
jgi:hypothetical protein